RRIIGKDVMAKVGHQALEPAIRQFAQQLVICEVGAPVLAGQRRCPKIEILVRQFETAGIHSREQLEVGVDGGFETSHEHLFHLRSWRAECERFEWTGLWNEPQHRGYEPRADARPVILLSPLFLIARAGKIEQKFLFRNARNFLDERAFFELPGYSSHARDDRADAVAERSDRQVQASKNVLHFEAIS